MFKIKWSELGARLSRVFSSEKELETAVAGLRQAGISVKQVIAPASIARLKPKSKPKVPGGRGTSIVGADGREIKVGEKCFYRMYTGEWKRGTLERVKQTPHDGALAWVAGKYKPWRMVSAKDIRALPVQSPDDLVSRGDPKLARALTLYPSNISHHEARAAEKRTAAV